MANWVICKLLIHDNWFELLVDWSEIFFEELGLDLSKFVKLDKWIFKGRLFFFCEGLNHHSRHEWQQLDKIFSVFTFSNLQIIAHCLQCSKFNFERLELKGAFENLAEFILEFDKVIEDVAEETIENRQCRVDLCIHFTLNELEQKV